MVTHPRNFYQADLTLVASSCVDNNVVDLSDLGAACRDVAEPPTSPDLVVSPRLEDTWDDSESESSQSHNRKVRRPIVSMVRMATQTQL